MLEGEDWQRGDLEHLHTAFILYRSRIGKDGFAWAFSSLHFIKGGTSATAMWNNGQDSVGYNYIQFNPTSSWSEVMGTLIHEMTHEALFWLNEETTSKQYALSTGWRLETDRYFIELGSVKLFPLDDKWDNPHSGPTEYSRTFPEPYEDLRESVMVQMVPGVPEHKYPLTQKRIDWIYNDFFNILREKK